MVGAGERERVDDAAAHRDQVGVIEHHALGSPGRPAGVDQQCQRVVGKVRGRQRPGGRCRRQLARRDHRPNAGVEVRHGIDDQHLGVGIRRADR